MSEATDKPAGLPWARIIPLFAVVFFGFFGYAMISVIFVPMLLNPEETFLAKDASVSLRAALAGLLLAAYPLGQFLGSPVIGALSDRFGRRPVLLISLGLTIAMYVNIALALQFESYAWLIAACFVCGLGEANVALAQSTLADVTTAADRGRAFGYMYACGSLAYLTGPVIGGQLAAAFGYALPFWIMLGPLAIGWLSLLVFFRETHEPDPTKPIAVGRSLANLRYVVTDAYLRPVYLLNLLMYTAMYAFYRVVVFFMVHKWQMSVDTMTLWYAGYAAGVTVAMLIVMPWLSKRMSLAHITSLSCIVGGALICLMPWPPQAFIAIAILGYPASVFAGLMLAACAGFISTQAAGDRQGHVMGNNQALQVGGEAGGAALGGALAALWMPLPLLVFGGLVVVAGFGYLPFNRRKPVEAS
ncbi:MAG: MFS transporter [Planctomycetota bacterium]